MNQLFVLKGNIDDRTAGEVIRYLFRCEEMGKPAVIFINSTEGKAAASLAIYDACRALKSRIVTVGAEEVGGMAAFILAAGSRGFRFLCRDTVYYGVGELQYQVPEDAAARKLLQKAEDKLYKIYLNEVKEKPYDRILDAKVRSRLFPGKSEEARYKKAAMEIEKILV